jgi:DNA replication and repair protein RecF
MARVTRLRVQNIRAHSDYMLELSPEVTVITGPNGSGKTSLIEALHVALQGASFKGSDTEMLTHASPWYRIDAVLDTDDERTVKFDPVRPSGRKQFSINGKTHYRLPRQQKYPVVLFEPDDLRLLHGSPARRRQFIDRLISQFDAKYASALSRYERALKQRNSLLKQSNSDDALFVWDMLLSEHGAYIVEARLRTLARLNEQLATTYNDIAHTGDVVEVRYSLDGAKATQQQLLTHLHQHHERDRFIGFTSVGPHRDDVLFSFNNSPAASASRGETRSIVLALKFLEVELLERAIGKPPIVLLDDVFSELDEARRSKLLGVLKNQLIVTSTELHQTNEVTGRAQAGLLREVRL